MNNVILYFAIFFVAFVFSAVATPVFRKLAAHYDFMDTPKSEQHKLHRNAIPLLGGCAMFSGWILTILLGVISLQLFPSFVSHTNLSGFAEGMKLVNKEFTTICVCAFVSMAWGLIDDKKPMSALTKFIGQVIIASVVVFWGGVRISCFIDSYWITGVLTVFWLLFMLNAINFLDNMDGLAVGISAIAFLFFTVAAGINGQYLAAALGACSCAAACGFWLYNKNPATIFMGDSGSHFLAFLLGIISTKVTYFNPEIASTKFAILIPVFILAVPIFDTFAVVAIRLHNHQSIYKGDHNHISHRFAHLGMSRKTAVLMVHLLVFISSLGALPLLWGEIKTCIVSFIQGITVFLLLTIVQFASHHDSGECAPVPSTKKIKRDHKKA